MATRDRRPTAEDNLLDRRGIGHRQRSRSGGARNLVDRPRAMECERRPRGPRQTAGRCIRRLLDPGMPPDGRSVVKGRGGGFLGGAEAAEMRGRPAAVMASSESSPGRECRSGVSIRPKRTVSTRSRAGPPRPPQHLSARPLSRASTCTSTVCSARRQARHHPPGVPRRNGGRLAPRPLRDPDAPELDGGDGSGLD